MLLAARWERLPPAACCGRTLPAAANTARSPTRCALLA